MCLNCPQAIYSSAASSVHAENEACPLPAAARQRRQDRNAMKQHVIQMLSKQEATFI